MTTTRTVIRCDCPLCGNRGYAVADADLPRTPKAQRVYAHNMIRLALSPSLGYGLREHLEAAMSTYHGITYAKCHVCGYETSDDTTLEMWNDYGVGCPKADGNGHPNGKTEWHVNGVVSYTYTDAEGEYLEDAHA